MALNYYFGYDENGRVGRRTTGLRPPFGGSNRLMFITHRTPKYTECDEVRMAIQGGCSWIQLRMKDGIYEDTVRKCATICAEECERIVDFCVNDDLEAAVTCGATACHLGKNDMPLDIAWEVLRDKLDSNAIFYIGATVNTFEDIRLAVERGASYIGLGPYRFTGTKKNLSPILGLDGYRKIIAQGGWHRYSYLCDRWYYAGRRRPFDGDGYNRNRCFGRDYQCPRSRGGNPPVYRGNQ